MEHEAGRDGEPRVDVAGSGMVLAALQPSAELAGGKEEVDVVRADKVLGQVDDRILQRRLAVMICGVLGDVADELGDLDVVLQLLLEGAVQHLALRGLEAVHDRRHGAGRVVLGELNELLVHEVVICQVVLGVVDVHTVLVGVDPVLAVVSPLFVEGEINGLSILVVVPLERQLVVLDVLEVLLGLLGGARTQAFVVLALPALAIVCPPLPLLVLRQREEATLVLAVGVLPAFLPDLDDGCHEFLEEAIQPDQ
mmetsp:Transcript_73240/g.212108  ORF Transcript_73240/g.212108 Transcript_73240/m.212108 type:complete len:253 (+) Transcript_73240:2152-2910(+)